MIHLISRQLGSKSSSWGIQGFENEISTHKNKATNVFIKSHGNKVNAAEHLCMRKGKPRVIKDDDTPAGVAIGLVEIFAGCLLCIIPHPATIGLGVAAIGDGAQRLANAGEDLDKKSREENLWPNGVPRPIDKSRSPE